MPAPAGILNSRTQGEEVKVGSVFAFGVMATADLDLRPHLFAGVGVNQTFRVRARGTDADSYDQLDLLLRVGAITGVADRAHLYGYSRPGTHSSAVPASTRARAARWSVFTLA